MASPSKWAKENLSCESLPSSGWEASVVMFGQEASLNPTLPFFQCLSCLMHRICTCHLTPEYFYFTTVWAIYIKIGKRKSWIFKRTFQTARASLVAQLVKNPPAMQETWVQSQGWEDPREKEKAIHSNILAWQNSRDYTVHGVAKSQTQLSDLHFTFKQPNIFLAGMILKTKIKLKERKRDEKQEACILGYSLSPLVQFNRSVKSKSLWPLGLQYARLPCPSRTPGAYSNSCPLSRWCHSTISFSVVPFSSSLQSFPASGSFQMSQFLASGGQNIGSFSLSISPSSDYSGLIFFRMDWLDLLAVQGTLKSLFQHHSLKASILQHSAFFTVQLSHP